MLPEYLPNVEPFLRKHGIWCFVQRFAPPWHILLRQTVHRVEPAPGDDVPPEQQRVGTGSPPAQGDRSAVPLHNGG